MDNRAISDKSLSRRFNRGNKKEGSVNPEGVSCLKMQKISHSTNDQIQSTRRSRLRFLKQDSPTALARMVPGNAAMWGIIRMRCAEKQDRNGKKANLRRAS